MTFVSGSSALLVETGMARAGAECAASPPVESATSAGPAPLHKWFLRGLSGWGGVPQLPADDRAPHLVLDLEIGAYPLGQIVSTGASASFALDAYRQWTVWSGGLFAQIHVTSLFLSGLWAYPYDPRQVPFRLDVGERVGIASSDSRRPANDVPDGPTYTLIRPELMTFAELGISIRPQRDLFFLLRAALDTSVNLETLFRASGSVGLEYSWGKGSL
jgi:hypothetical protein